MGSTAVLRVDQVVLTALILGVFALVGFRRGANRELRTLLFLAISFVIVTQLMGAVVPLLNRLHKTWVFLSSEGLWTRDGGVLWNQTMAHPDMIAGEAARRNVSTLLFALLALLAYAFGEMAVAAGTPMSRLTGALLGAVNGFIIASYLFRYALVVNRATIELSSGEMRETVMSSRTIGIIVIVLVLALIIFGLYGAGRRRSSRGGGRDAN